MFAPGFSVIIPTFQRRDMVCDALRAVAALEYGGEIEVIVVVDGSNDGTVAALAKVPCPFPLAIVEQANAGAASARNRGAREARHSILLFLDDDMIARPDLVEQHARAHAGGADGVFGDIPLDAGSPPGFLVRGVGLWITERSRRLGAGGALGVDDLLTGQLSVRKDVFEQLGGFDTVFTAGGSFGNEDVDFGLRLIERHRVVYCPQAISHQRYIVTPAQNLRQWREAGAADAVLARKHPRQVRTLLQARGAGQWQARLVDRPLAAVPGLAWLLARFAGTACHWLSARGRTGDRIAARLFYRVRQVVYWAGVRDAGGFPHSRRLSVLCLHAVADLSGDPVLADYGLPRERLVALLDGLRRSGCHFVSAEHLLAALEEGAPLPRRAVLLTFDDCYAELADVAVSILRPRAIPAVAFAVTGMTSGSNEWDQAIGAARLPLLGGEGLRALAGAGVEIGCHGRNHRALPPLGDAELQEETAGAADDLAAAGLPRPRLFAYPYGEADARSARAAAQAGFSAAFALATGQAGSRTDRFRLARAEILAGDSVLAVRWKLWRNRLRLPAGASTA